MAFLTWLGRIKASPGHLTGAEFGQDMLESDEFVAMIKTLKPWGDEELIMIPYSRHPAATNDEEYGVITVKYEESL